MFGFSFKAAVRFSQCSRLRGCSSRAVRAPLAHVSPSRSCAARIDTISSSENSVTVLALVPS